MSPDPEVTCIERHEDDNYMLIACDGIYDVMSNEEIVEFVNHRFEREENEANISNTLIDLCLHKVIPLPYNNKLYIDFKGSKDNMSSIIISFDKGRPEQDSEKVKEDKQLNEDIRLFVKGKGLLIKGLTKLIIKIMSIGWKVTVTLTLSGIKFRKMKKF